MNLNTSADLEDQNKNDSSNTTNSPVIVLTRKTYQVAARDFKSKHVLYVIFP